MTNLPQRVVTAQVHGHARHRGATVSVPMSKERLEHIESSIWELLMRCLEPTETETLLAEEFTASVIAAAINHALIIDADAAAPFAAWESYSWDRAAHLLFSQRDLDYLEQEVANDSATLEAVTTTRRQQVSKYLTGGDYPNYRPFSGDRVNLPDADESPPTPVLRALMQRRSVRAFVSKPVPLHVVGSILWKVTEPSRATAQSQASGDPYFLLNSANCWLELHLINQGVADLQDGVYRYDPFGHCLYRTRDRMADGDVMATVARQPWAEGPGAALFIVVDWQRFRWLYRHSRAYINLLIDIGEVGQQILQEIYQWNLGGWLTPAIHESRASRLLSLPSSHDPMMFVKFGWPVQ